MRRDAVELIAITDHAEALVPRARAAVHGGATMIQLRLKHADARTLAAIARALIEAVDVPVIINDRADVALAVGAAGAHLGADDVPIPALRNVVPPGFILGASAGNDAELDEAMGAGADYVGIGAVYATGSKSDAGAPIGINEFARLAARAAQHGLPAVAVGGITAATAHTVREAGAAGVAVISAIFGAHDPEAAARALRAE
jgi:thiamine-phosphate pyrophosphorylase